MNKVVMILAVTNPDYITVKETAETWDVTKRWVNMCIEGGRIPGAVRMGNMWLVPKGADKPIGSRREQKLPQEYLLSELVRISEAVPASVPRHNPDRVMDTASEERFRLLYEGSFAYARGDFARTIRCFHKHEGDDAAKLCACSLAIAAAISTGDYQLYTKIESWLKGIVQANISSKVTTYVELALVSAYLGAMAPNMVPEWIKDGDFAALTITAKADSAYKRAKYFHCIGQYESMLAVAQTALAFYDSEQEISLISLYLRLTSAIALYALDRIDEARRYLLDAMRIYLPHGFITPFTELITPLGGLVEQCLQKEFPAHYDAMIEQWTRTVPNWIMFHNSFTKDNIALILSRRDYEIALLAARGVSYVKIAKQFNISVGRLNNIMREICEKLFISGKKELAKFVLISPKKT